MENEKFGHFISELRKEQNMTQKDLAEKLNVTIQAVSKWERGLCYPDISLFKPLSEILNVSITDLMNGKKIDNDKMPKRKVDDNIFKVLDYAKKELYKKRKEALIIIVSIIVISLLLIGYSLYTVGQVKKNINTCNGFDEKMGIDEKNDGWIYSFEIDYTCDGSKTYTFMGDNLKYKQLKDYYAIGTEVNSNGEKFEYQIVIDHPSLIFNDEYKDDVKMINTYFNNKQFNRVITVDDIGDLELKNISKVDIINLFNKTINSTLQTKFGGYSYLPPTQVLESLVINDYKWGVGYLNEHGYIRIINIELLYKDQYLSYLIENGTATSDQIEIAKNIDLIEKYVIEKQKFDVPDNLKNINPYIYLKNGIFSEIIN